MNPTKTLLASFLFAAALHAQAPVHPAVLADADEVRLGQVLADKFMEEDGMAATPQTRKIDEYLQAIGDRVAAHARATFHIAFASTPVLHFAAR